MEERRKNRRMELGVKLLIKNLNNTNEEVSVAVSDVSKTGLGFVCDSVLDVGTVYEAHLTIWTKDTLHAFLEIIRSERTEEGQYRYGAIFIGMSEIDASRIQVYETMGDLENIG
ncbi:MAG: PilZ domain-containing protein [Muribaculaceae bacterium]|nr:PilZ domain-containing protein [Muribaculaceae bacterium]